MTTYRTGNPIGSTDPKDLYDNAENTDVWVNSLEREYWNDRFGRNRKTIYGMEQDFQQFLIDSGYVNIGDYIAGLEITERNQIFWKDGELYRAGASLELPYTTTGDWETEGSLFLAVGDQALRQDISQGSGSSMVGTIAPSTDAAYRTVKEKIYETISVEDFGAICDGITDSTIAFQSACEYARQNNKTLIAAGGGPGYVINSSIQIYTETEIRAPLIFPADGQFRYIEIRTNHEYDTVPLSSLSGLTEGSSKISGLPYYAIGRFVHIESEEVLTERNNPPNNTPYYKNTAFYLMNEDGEISPSLDMGFNSEFESTVKIFRPEKRIKVHIESIISSGSGDSNIEIKMIRDSVDLHVGNFNIESNNARTLISVQSNDCNIYANNADGAGYDGLGYGISVGLSCKTGIYGVNGAVGRSILDGRHGSLVTVRDCIFNSAGSHWGNGYIFENCHIGAYSWSGKDLTILGGSLTKWIAIRSDVALATGRLFVNGLDFKGNIFISWSSTVRPDFFSTPRRFFQEILIENLRALTTADMQLIGSGSSANIETYWAHPRKILVNNLFAPNCRNISAINLPMDNVRSFSHPSKYTFKNVDLYPDGVFTVSMRGPSSGYPAGIIFEIDNCGTVRHRIDASGVEKSTINDCRVILLQRINSSQARGPIIINGGSFEPEAPTFTESPKGFNNVELIGDVTMGTGTDGPRIFQIGCRARNGTTGYATPIDYFVDTSMYINN